MVSRRHRFQRALNDPQDPNLVILSLGGIASDGTVIPTSLHIENFDRVAVFQEQLREASIEDGSGTFNTPVRTFDQNRNDNLQDFDPSAENIDEVAELFAGTDLLDGNDVADNGNNNADDDGNDAAGDVADDDGGAADDVVANDNNNGAGGAEFFSFSPDAEQLSVIREDLEAGDTAGISVDNFSVGEIPASLRDPGNPNQVLISEGGVDAEGNDVPPSLLFDPAVLERQANIRIALEESFPGDPEVRNLLQRQFDQVRNDNLRAFEMRDDVDDVSGLFADLDLPAVGEVNLADENADDQDVDQGNDDADVDEEIVVDDEAGNDGDNNNAGVVLEGSQGGDVLQGTDGDDVINALTGRDELFGEGGNDLLDAGGGEDIVRGGDGDDTIIGGGGQDELFGEAGNDTIIGTNGDDRLDGGAGNDRLNGDLNNDTIVTGAGADTIIFGADGGNDRITDFEAGVDSLEINGFGGNVELEAVQRGADTVLRINNNDRIVLEDFNADEFNPDDVTFDDQAIA